MAALEAEKFLAEQDGHDTADADSDVRKGSEKADGDVPEYRSNPLLGASKV
jgi:thioredoxin reductase (NADPH)